MEPIHIRPIGIIRTPYREDSEIPIQGRFEPKAEGCVELDESFLPGLKDLEGFTHLYLLYYFHRSKQENLVGKPFLEDVAHGIFAIRGPHRPNHIGLSVVRLRTIQGNRIYFTEVDMLDGTPLLDIKPYVRYFDHREDVVSGWVERHFQQGIPPENTVHS